VEKAGRVGGVLRNRQAGPTSAKDKKLQTENTQKKGKTGQKEKSNEAQEKNDKKTKTQARKSKKKEKKTGRRKKKISPSEKKEKKKTRAKPRRGWTTNKLRPGGPPEKEDKPQVPSNSKERETSILRDGESKRPKKAYKPKESNRKAGE